ncbi:MAG: hypothetical protein LPJ92_12015 [Rhodobacterales bacterium]|nr:hypothetical protein [Rhodobacterales bacterium]MDX5391061.1 hypothetical protein [Rhodobacterales bacterium]MDX5490756.1 hypothetical protein [Rhodobacterales bacterium]
MKEVAVDEYYQVSDKALAADKKPSRLDLSELHCVQPLPEKILSMGETNTADGVVVEIHVMLDKYEDGPDRKLCELLLPVEELRAVLAHVESKLF